MVQCFAPDCKHQSESHTCKFLLFPNKEKNKEEYRRWVRLLRYETMLFKVAEHSFCARSAVFIADARQRAHNDYEDETWRR